MKVIVLNKKRIGVTLIIIGLMLILVALEKSFDDRLKFTVLVQNNISTFKTYKGIDDKFSYKLPENWICTEQKYENSNIIYNNEFLSADYKIQGFVQVLNFDTDLRSFLDENRAIGLSKKIYENYSITPLKFDKYDKKEGYSISFNTKNSLGISSNAYEYFIKDKNYMYKVSFSIRSEVVRENTTVIFDSIIKTIKYIK